jgi:C1A family cysteine protease
MVLNIAYKKRRFTPLFLYLYKIQNAMKLLNFFKNLFRKPKPISKRYNFGWKKDLHDPRDFKYKVSPPEAPKVLPPLVDLRPQCPPVYNQGNLGSCTANAIGSAFQFEQMKQNAPNWIPSRLFIYYNEREMEGTINEDAGAMIRDGIKSVVDKGVCPETMWQYVESKFTSKPCPQCYKEALNNQVKEYLRISPHTLQGVKEALADGHPVIFGFTIYESMMTDEVARTGIVPIPIPNDTPVGGHAVKAVGYIEDRQCFIVKNSWGTNWGDNGYFYLPYWYITTPNAAADFWVIKLVESENA